MKKVFFLFFSIVLLSSCSNNVVDMTNSKKKIISEELEKIFTNNDLVGKEFLIETETYKDNKITIGFTKDRVYGFSGVNRYFAKYKITNNRLVIDVLGVTRMAGSREASLAELVFLTALKDNKEIKLEGPYLELISNQDSNFIFKDISSKENLIIGNK